MDNAKSDRVPVPDASFIASQSRPLLGLAGALTGDPWLAEELVQDVIEKVFKQWGRISNADNPSAYIRRMLVNEHLSWKRKWSRFIPSDRWADRIDDDSDHADQLASRAELAGLLRKLPPRQRAVLALRYYEGYSDQQIAAVLGCAPGTVRGYASRALATLQAHMINADNLT